MEKNNLNICIDFGTCNTVISYSEDFMIKQVLDEITGDVLIPTTIYFIDSELVPNIKVDDLKYSINYFIGSGANDLFNSEKNITNYFYQFKRFLGITSKNIDKYKIFLSRFNLDYTTDEDTIYFYIPINDSDSKLKISIIDLIKLFFKALYSVVKIKFSIGEENISTIITCPAYFNDLQRSQLKRAAESSGFTVTKILNEPTTAAIYYIDKYKKNQNLAEQINSNKFIIYDLGGGTIDTTVVEYHETDNTCEVIDIDGNNGLGGIDIDNLLVEDIYLKYSIDKENSKWKNKIRKYAEEIKIKLTYQQNHDIFLESVPIKKLNKSEIIDNLKITY